MRGLAYWPAAGLQTLPAGFPRILQPCQQHLARALWTFCAGHDEQRRGRLPQWLQVIDSSSEPEPASNISLPHYSIARIQKLT